MNGFTFLLFLALLNNYFWWWWRWWWYFHKNVKLFCSNFFSLWNMVDWFGLRFVRTKQFFSNCNSTFSLLLELNGLHSYSTFYDCVCHQKWSRTRFEPNCHCHVIQSSRHHQLKSRLPLSCLFCCWCYRTAPPNFSARE